MTTLFISDLHLSGERPETLALFQAFLAGEAREAEALYILGDLFEAWLGDDVILPDYTPVIEALRQLSDSGVALYLMHGNRDFLMGERLMALTGATLLDDPSVIVLNGIPTLLMHGDLLCSDDTAYLAMRQQLRNPQWITAFLQKTPEERIAFARDLRERSRQETGEKDEAIMDVNALTVAAYMQQHGVRHLIHGHTHRPAIHQEPSGERIVLGDWYRTGSVLKCDKTGCRLTPV